MRVLVDRERCVASGMCVLASNKVFTQDEDGIVQLLQSEAPAELHESVIEAVRACPAGAIEADD
ncbi:ferredoxin [Dactylosporangium sp. CA-233914]|uniref:ferredoxin n=1 Tax=Dactylosporangium sp. CA-233914 TaxID=3239934 RepID=UPI003D9500EB